MPHGREKRAGHGAARFARHDNGRWSGEQRENRRRLAQNFLRDGRVARRIVLESKVKGGDLVLEIGAGGGMLTRQLARVAREVVAVEYDPRWAERLERRFCDDRNVRVVREDALVVRLPDEPFLVVANLPFGITTSFLHRLLDDPGVPLRSAHLLVQKEVALKHARSSPTTLKTLNWSPWYEFSAGLAVPSEAFHPAPTVDACLLVAAKRDPPLLDARNRHLFRAFVRQAFEGRGNVVGNTLLPTFTSTQIRRLAQDNGFSRGSFPSDLTAGQWSRVFEFMVRNVPRDRWPSPASAPRKSRQRPPAR